MKKAFKGCVMETRAIQLRTHQKNIDHYHGLLKTKLNETERQYLEKRVCEETIAMLLVIEHKEFWLSKRELPHDQNPTTAADRNRKI